MKKNSNFKSEMEGDKIYNSINQSSGSDMNSNSTVSFFKIFDTQYSSRTKNLLKEWNNSTQDLAKCTSNGCSF